MCSHLWSILKTIPCALEKNVSSAALGWNALKILIKSTYWVCSLGLLFPCSFLSQWSIHWCQWGADIPSYDYITVPLSLDVHQDLLYIFRCSYVGFINVYKGYILLLDCSLYQYVMSFFVSYYGFILRFILLDISTTTLVFLFHFYLHEISFSITWLLICVYP